MKKQLFIFCLLVINLFCKGQFMDSIYEVIKQKRSFNINLESRISFINNQLTSVNGLRCGISFNRKLRIGGGFSWLNTDLFLDNEKQYLKFVYLCLYSDIVFYKTKRWQLSVPIQIGMGSSWFQKETQFSFSNKDSKYFLLLYEPGITTQFKVFKWLGFGTDVAYRFTLKNEKNIGENLNSPTYSFKILTWIDQLYYDFFPKSKLSIKHGPSFW